MLCITVMAEVLGPLGNLRKEYMSDISRVHKSAPRFTRRLLCKGNLEIVMQSWMLLNYQLNLIKSWVFSCSILWPSQLQPDRLQYRFRCFQAVYTTILTSNVTRFPRVVLPGAGTHGALGDRRVDLVGDLRPPLLPGDLCDFMLVSPDCKQTTYINHLHFPLKLWNLTMEFEFYSQTNIVCRISAVLS